MPPRTSHPLQNSFSSGAAHDEVVCPLQNADNSNCRKRCLGEKRYRSMQEHIRRAHPRYYLPKLPATKESFELMINTPPHDIDEDEQPNSHQPRHQSHNHHAPPRQQHPDPRGLSPAFNHYDPALSSSLEGYQALGQHDGGYYSTSDTDAAAIFHSMQAAQRTSDEYRRGSLIPAASAAAALAQLHYHRPESAEWHGDHIGQVIYPSLTSPTDTEADILQTYYGDQSELKPGHFHVDPALEDGGFMPDHTSFPVSSSPDQPGLMPSSLTRSPSQRDNLSSLHRTLSKPGHVNRPRKSSLSQQARMAKHERRKSKELGKRNSGEKKAFSTDPSNPASLFGKRWEDLIDAAASATEEEGSRDLTPIPQSPYHSPQVPSRTSLPPGFGLGSHFQSFQASPLTRALTPPPPADAPAGLDELQNFESIGNDSSNLSSHHHQSSADSGSQFQIMNPSSIESNSSPIFHQPPSGASVVQIYCAACRRLSVLKESFACTNCICGICSNCCEALFDSQSRGRMSLCPRCSSMEATFRPFQLDLR